MHRRGRRIQRQQPNPSDDAQAFASKAAWWTNCRTSPRLITSDYKTLAQNIPDLYLYLYKGGKVMSWSNYQVIVKTPTGPDGWEARLFNRDWPDEIWPRSYIQGLVDQFVFQDEPPADGFGIGTLYKVEDCGWQVDALAPGAWEKPDGWDGDPLRKNATLIRILGPMPPPCSRRFTRLPRPRLATPNWRSYPALDRLPRCTKTKGGRRCNGAALILFLTVLDPLNLVSPPD
jgi:hypothetical protein